MSVREIPAAEWQEFLDDFTRGHRAWLATVDRVQGGGEDYVEAVDRPLGSVKPEIQAHRVVAIEIRFQEDGRATEPIVIESPTSVRVDENEIGATRGLEIRDDEGECTRIRFRTLPPPQMLDGIAAGEQLVSEDRL